MRVSISGRILSAAIFGKYDGVELLVGEHVDALVDRADMVMECVHQSLATGESHTLTVRSWWNGSHSHMVARIHPSGIPEVALFIVHQLKN
jgi:hypothetical protein